MIRPETPVAVPAGTPRRLREAERALYGNRWQMFDPPRAYRPKPKPTKPTERDPRVAAIPAGIPPQALDAVPPIPTDGEDMAKKVLRAAPTNPIYQERPVSYRVAEQFHAKRGAVSQSSVDMQGRPIVGPGGLAAPANGPGTFNLGANRARTLGQAAMDNINQLERNRPR